MSQACDRWPGKCDTRVTHRLKKSRLSERERKKGFPPANQSFTAERAMEEARRCLAFQSCDACEACSLLCPDLCITRDETTGNIVIDLDYCKGCGICAAVCPKGAIRMELEG